MKRTRFTEEQIIAVLHEANGSMSIREVSRKHGITEQTFFRWRAKYGGLQFGEANKLKALEDENRRLKKLVADLSLDNSMLKDVVGRKW